MQTRPTAAGFVVFFVLAAVASPAATTSRSHPRSPSAASSYDDASLLRPGAGVEAVEALGRVGRLTDGAEGGAEGGAEEDAEEDVFSRSSSAGRSLLEAGGDVPIWHTRGKRHRSGGVRGEGDAWRRAGPKQSSGGRGGVAPPSGSSSPGSTGSTESATDVDPERDRTTTGSSGLDPEPGGAATSAPPAGVDDTRGDVDGGGTPRSIAGWDLEEPEGLEAALEARARGSDKEIMLLAVGDTRQGDRSTPLPLPSPTRANGQRRVVRTCDGVFPLSRRETSFVSSSVAEERLPRAESRTRRDSERFALTYQPPAASCRSDPTRGDHRRVQKDPALRVISIGFVTSLIANLQHLGLHHYLLLTSSKELCAELQTKHGVTGCAWSSHLTDHAGLTPWGIKPGDMFLLWAQQWHYVERALRMGYSVMRVDSDVVFLEDPYPILNGPLMAPFALVSQTDIFASPTRPACGESTPDATHPGVGSCGHGPNCLINIGLTYFRGGAIAPDGPVMGLLRDMNAKFVSMLEGEPVKDGEGNAVSQALLDQPMFREMLDRRVGPSGGWRVASGAHAKVYGAKEGEASGGCPHSSNTCETIAAQRAKTAFSYVPLRDASGSVVELVAGAPDWLFGRGCVKTLLSAPSALKHVKGLYGEGGGQETCDSRAAAPGVVNHAPGGVGVGGGLVAIHMVYSKAHKRQEAMEVMGWWRSTPVASEKRSVGRRSRHLLGDISVLSDSSTTQTHLIPGMPRRSLRAAEDVEAMEDQCPLPLPPAAETATSPANRGVLFTHTYFRQMDPGNRAFLCGGRARAGGCPCCQPLPDRDDGGGEWVKDVASGVNLAFNTPDDHVLQLDPHQNAEVLRKAPGCGMSVDGGWNEFWDR